MLRVLSLFSGIGAFEKALERLNIEHEVLAYCEIDKYASKAYSIIHDIPESKNLVDVTKVDILDVEETVDLITYGFPCQDISCSGKQKGFTDEEGNRTRSGLFFEALRIIDDYRPKFAIAENVKALTSKKFSEEFKTVLASLNETGYNNYWTVLNAKDYGIPQNRERVFIISIRKDIDKGFEFPDPIPLKVSLKDFMDRDVDEKFYLSDKALSQFGSIEEIINHVKEIVGKIRKSAIGVTIKPNGDIRPYRSEDPKKPSVSDCQIAKDTNVSYTLTTKHISAVYGESTNFRIRNLTPTEYYTLMGFDVEDCRKCSTGGISNSQLYKQAGNSIVVNVLEAIFKRLGERYTAFTTPRHVSRPGGRQINGDVKEFLIVASRGRYANNPNDRTKGAPTKQRLEVNKEGICNTLTTVLKDNYLIEMEVVGK